jgi:hypothetical protein
MEVGTNFNNFGRNINLKGVDILTAERHPLLYIYFLSSSYVIHIITSDKSFQLQLA